MEQEIMSNYDNTNTGAIFKNDKRQKETQPHATGSVNIEGVEYWVSAWTKTSQSGNKFQSLAFTKKEGQVIKTTTSPQPAPEIDMDDDLPF